MYAKVINGQVVKYPYLLEDLYNDNPNTSFPANLTDDILDRFNFVRVVVTGSPEIDSRTQVAAQNGCAYSVERNRWETAWTIRNKTQEELDADTEAQSKSIRNKRNEKLSASDWTQVLDAPVDRAAWATYRQALRDITLQQGFPWDVQWPVEPN